MLKKSTAIYFSEEIPTGEVKTHQINIINLSGWDFSDDITLLQEFFKNSDQNRQPTLATLKYLINEYSFIRLQC